MSEFFKALGLSVLYINLIFIIWAKINELTGKAKLYKAMRENNGIRIVKTNITKED